MHINFINDHKSLGFKYSKDIEMENQATIYFTNDQNSSSILFRLTNS